MPASQALREQQHDTFVNISFICPYCEKSARLVLPLAAAPRCPACGRSLPWDNLPAPGQPLTACCCCGCTDLYRQKDFPHGLGLTLLGLACLASVITYGLYEKWLTWGILIGTALFDVLLYYWVGDVLVCYRCQARYRQVVGVERFPSFDLGIAERYRQERLRRQVLTRSPSGSPPAASEPAPDTMNE